MGSMVQGASWLIVWRVSAYAKFTYAFAVWPLDSGLRAQHQQSPGLYSSCAIFAPGGLARTCQVPRSLGSTLTTPPFPFHFSWAHQRLIARCYCLQVMHVGDRFTASGNDSAVRDCCSILWVANPEETDFFIRMLLSDIETNAAEENSMKSELVAARA